MNTNTEFRKQITDKSNWLCPNCIYSGNCVIESRAVTPIYYCEEHFVELRKKAGIQDHSIKPLPFELRKPVGLCETCDLKVSCSLRSEERIVFNCEHYH